MTGCSSEEGQEEDDNIVEEEMDTETEDTENNDTSGDAVGTDEGNPASEEDNEGMFGRGPPRER
ncbi:hypothetical protein ACQCVP_04185 [Rossellomorea vietnamensis]|uniref:hypothetical protein n=1 Tax=Rossellomorea vietnamensis TaxID=218284 RepID=UPI003CF28541